MKSEKMWENKMAEMTDTVRCADFGDMVAFLYGETTEMESRDFRLHLDVCATCRGELAAFGKVREDIGAWRNEALNPIAVMATNAATERSDFNAVPNRSALAALREFFTLSPLWLRGVTAFASVLFVTLLIVTALQFFKRSETQIVKQTPSVTPNQDQKLPTGVEKQDKLAVLSSEENAPGDVNASPSPRTSSSNIRVAPRTKSNRGAKAPVLSDEERSQLSDLLIAANEDEESVPRLYDLLSESN